jgi:creatinine amidohydrolase
MASERGARVIVLPAIPIGANAQQLSTPLTLNLHPSTQARVLADILESLEHHEVRKLLVLNGHGGNDFKQIVRELQPSFDVFICCSNWWSVLDASAYFDDPGDHAGELETSVMLYLRPELVLGLDEAGSGAARRFRLSGLREGVAWAPRDWASVTSDTGVGDPSAATEAKGQQFFGDVCRTLADFLVDLSGADVTDLYETDGSDI